MTAYPPSAAPPRAPGPRRRTVLGAGGLAALGAVLAAAPARAEDPAAAPDVVVFCEPTLRAALRATGDDFRRRTGVPVRLFASPTALILQQIARGLRSDLVVIEADPDMLRAVVARGLLRKGPNPEMTFWRNRLVVAASGTTADAGSLRGALGATGRVALVDPGVNPAGERTAAALRAAGLADVIAGRAIGTASTADARFLLTDGTAQRAIVYATDLPGEPALAWAGTVPSGTYAPPGYGIGVVHNAVSVNTARFAAFLNGADAAPALRAAGLETGA